jgi:hypothetical protein
LEINHADDTVISDEKTGKFMVKLNPENNEIRFKASCLNGMLD